MEKRLAFPMLSFLLLSPAGLFAQGFSACDVNQNGSTDIGDAIAAINQVLSVVPCTTGDVNGDGICNIVDVQIIINAILGGTCTATRAVPSTLSCTPASLESGAVSSCTVTLSKAAGSGGASVALSSNLPALGVPASVAVAYGSTIATFSATAGSLSTNQTAVVTATFNGASQTAFISLVASTTLTGLACSPTSMGSMAVSSCTVTLSKAAGSGTSVSVSSNLTALSVPTSVAVAYGSTIATFSATAGSLSTDQTAVVTATFGGSSQTTSIGLVVPPLVSLLTCAPTSLGSGTVSTCTVTLSKAAGSGGATVPLFSSLLAVSVPASVTVASGSTSATFSATAGSLSTDQIAVYAIPSNTYGPAIVPLVMSFTSDSGKRILLVPCCARSVKCGLANGDVSEASFAVGHAAVINAGVGTSSPMKPSDWTVPCCLRADSCGLPTIGGLGGPEAVWSDEN